METIDYSAPSDVLVLHFDGERRRISALTLAETLSEFVRAFEIINHELEPGSDLKLHVIETQRGSFKIKLSGDRRELLENVWKRVDNIGTGVLIGVLIYHLTVGMEEKPPSIEIHGDVTIIQGSNYNVTLPAEAAEPVKRLSQNSDLEGRVRNGFRTLERDDEVSGLGISRQIDDEPDFLINRRSFRHLSRDVRIEPGDREIIRDVEVTILKAVFERGTRRWQFILNGEKISAPIIDESFFDKLAEREIVIGDGDTLVITLSTLQEWNELIEVWVNKSHRVIKVHEHHPREIDQDDLF